MNHTKTRSSAFARRARALLMALPVAAALVLSGVQPAYAQTEPDQKVLAIMAAISLLLMECTDEDKDTLCDVDEIKYFGNVDDEDAAGDFDDDGVSNGDELNLYRSNPDSTDTDSDGLSDGAEAFLSLSLTVPAVEGDTLGSDSPADKALMHKLNRLTFGPTQDELAQIVALPGGFDDWLDAQLIPLDIPLAPTRNDAAVAPLYGTNDDEYPKPYDCDDVGYDPVDPAQEMRDCYVSYRHDFADIPGTFRPVHSIKQLQSRMAMFWDNHFNTDLRSHGRGMQELMDEDGWFLNAFGNFRDLLELNAKNYTMLEYLDLDDNRKYSPNENFPREIMELHSLGIDGGYTATDIAELAYILTGWDHQDVRDIGTGEAGACVDPDRIVTCPEVSRYAYYQEANNDGADDGMGEPETGEDRSAKFDSLRIFKYKDYDHDDGGDDYDGDGDTNLDKTLFLNTAHEITIASRGNEFGQDEGDEALTFLAQHPATAKFICTKLAQEFVSDTPSQTTTDSCEAVFLANPLASNQMGLVLKDLLDSAEFSDPATQRGKLKDTQEVMFSLGRLLGWDASHPGVSRYLSLGSLIGDAEQPLFFKAEPTGYYEPAENWLNTNIALKRFQSLNDMVFDDQTYPFVTYFKDDLGLTAADEIMTHLFLLMLGGHYDGHDIQLGVDALIKVDPDDADDIELQDFDITAPDAEERLRMLISRLAALPEFQLH